MTIDAETRVWTIPNLLTMIRLASTPVFIAAVAAENLPLAWSMLAVGGVTDGLDGLLARLLNQRSRLGALLDPVADKALMTSSYAALAWKGWIPSWLAALVIGRDLVIVGGLGLLKRLGVDIAASIRPSLVSKANTGLQILLLLAALYNRTASSSLDGFLWWLALVVAALTVISGIDYVLRGFRLAGMRRK